MGTPLPKLETYYLLIFYYVCKEKSISNAAERLFLSQPTITSHIKSLEESAQIKLINIERKKLTLTKAGEGLYKYASVIFQQTMAAQRFIELLRETSVMIGACSLLTRVMGKTVNAMQKKVSNLTRIEVKFGESYKLVKQVIENEIDLAIVPDLDYGFNNIERIRVKDNLKLCFFATPSHPVFKRDKLAWKDL